MYLVPSMPTQSRVASGNLNRYFSPPKRKRKKAVSHPSEDRQKAAHRKLTTSFLTATALVYTLGFFGVLKLINDTYLKRQNKTTKQDWQ